MLGDYWSYGCSALLIASTIADQYTNRSIHLVASHVCMSTVFPILSIMLPCGYEGTSHGLISHSIYRSGAAKKICEAAMQRECNLECNTECMAVTTWRDKVDSASTIAIVVR